MAYATDPLSSKQLAAEELSEVAYTPFKLVTYKLVEDIADYRRLLDVGSYDRPLFRSDLLNKAKTVFDEVHALELADSEKAYLGAIIDEMVNASDNMDTIQKGLIINYYNARNNSALDKIYKDYMTQLQSKSHEYLREITNTMQRHGAGIKSGKKDSQIEVMKHIFEGKSSFLNLHKIPITIEAEFFCRLCYLRVLNKYDNVFIVEADTGKGKTSCVWALGSTLSEMLGNDFTISRNFIFNEDKSYADKLIRNAPFGFVLNFDEIGNQANAKTHWDPGQILLMNDTRLVRFMGLTIFGCWTSKDELDKQLRTRINGLLTIEQRGVAQFRTYNKNRFTPNKEFIPFQIKNKVAYTSADANNIIEMYDELNHMTIPFYSIPPAIWKEYEEQKMLAKTMRRQGGKYFSRIQTAGEYYTEFMSELPLDVSQITSEMLAEYSQKNAYQLSFKKLVSNVCNATGKRKADIFVWSKNPADEWDGYINVDPVIISHITKLKAMKQGSKETEGNGL